MSKNRKDDNEIKARRGLFPWSVTEYNWVMQTFLARRKNIKGNLQLTAEFAHLKDEIPYLSPGELYNLNSMILMSHIFHERYPGELEYNAHFFRFHEIKEFLHAYAPELFELGLNKGPEDIMNINPKLLESLCVLPFTLEETDEEGESYFTFSFEDVVDAAAGKLSPAEAEVLKKKSDAKSDDMMEKAHRGLIPWSVKEFNWVVEKQMRQSRNTKKKQQLQEEYQPLKEQMFRMGDKIASNFDTMILLNEIFHQRYPDPVEAMAHFFRYHSIFKFLEKYRNELIKDGLLEMEGSDNALKPQLLDSLCTLPFSLELPESTNDKGYTFLYSEVATTTRNKISAPLN